MDTRRTSHRILVPLDGSALSEAAMPTAVELGEALHADWILLRVIAPPSMTWAMEAGAWGPVAPWEPESMPREDVARDVRQYLETVRSRMPHPERVTVDVREDGLPDGILQAQQDHRATLMVMSTHGRGGLDRLVMGSVTDLVIRLARVPVVVVRPALKA
jgi:nucleotide-binding universal stress UspA family protein